MGFGVYIWNVTQTTEVVAMLKKLRPDITIILGGPEVSYETEQQEIVALADHVITGEADVKFAEVCRRLLNDESRRGERSEAMANDEEMPELELHSPFVITEGASSSDCAARPSCGTMTSTACSTRRTRPMRSSPRGRFPLDSL